MNLGAIRDRNSYTEFRSSKNNLTLGEKKTLLNDKRIQNIGSVTGISLGMDLLFERYWNTFFFNYLEIGPSGTTKQSRYADMDRL